MKIWYKALFAAGIIASAGCGEDSDSLSAAISQLASLESIDLSCDFDDITGSDETEDAYSLQDYTCEDATEQYALLLEDYDVDADEVLSDDELAEAEAEFDAAQQEAMDSDANGEVSDEEKTAWRTNELPRRKDQRKEQFGRACEDLGKTEAECIAMREAHKERHRAAIEARKAEFDTDEDGVLSEEERAAMKATLDAERKARRDTFVAANDSDGDGKIGPAEREQRKGNRKTQRDANRPAPEGQQGQGGQGQQGQEGGAPPPQQPQQ